MQQPGESPGTSETFTGYPMQLALCIAKHTKNEKLLKFALLQKFFTESASDDEMRDVCEALGLELQASPSKMAGMIAKYLLDYQRKDDVLEKILLEFVPGKQEQIKDICRIAK